MSEESRILSVDEKRRVLTEAAAGDFSGKVVIARAVWDWVAFLGAYEKRLVKIGYMVRELSPKPVLDSSIDAAFSRLNERSRDYANLPETRESETIRLLKALQRGKG